MSDPGFSLGGGGGAKDNVRVRTLSARKPKSLLIRPGSRARLRALEALGCCCFNFFLLRNQSMLQSLQVNIVISYKNYVTKTQ